jgi:hypothetical protein
MNNVIPINQQVLRVQRLEANQQEMMDALLHLESELELVRNNLVKLTSILREAASSSQET